MPKNVCAELSTQIIAEIGLTYCHPGKLEAMFLEIRHHRHLGHILLDDDFPVGIILPLVQLAPDVFFGDAQDIGKPADNNSFILQIHGKYRHTQTGSILHQRLPVPVVNNPPSGLNLYLSHPVVHCKHLVALSRKPRIANNNSPTATNTPSLAPSDLSAGGGLKCLTGSSPMRLMSTE